MGLGKEQILPSIRHRNAPMPFHERDREAQLGPSYDFDQSEKLQTYILLSVLGILSGTTMQ